MRITSITQRAVLLAAATAGGLTLAQPAAAATTLLDFSGAICGPLGNQSCGNGSDIGQNYGDSASVDVSYRSIAPITGATFEPFLKYWAGGYGDLVGVVWGGANSDYAAEIVFTPTAGFEVSLTSFQAGCYQNRGTCQTLPYTVTSLGGAAIASGNPILPAGGHAEVSIASAYLTDGIVLRWGPDGYDGGLDNITFDVRAVSPGGGGAVPEPATWAMLVLGFGITGAAVRRRRRFVTIAG